MAGSGFAAQDFENPAAVSAVFLAQGDVMGDEQGQEGRLFAMLPFQGGQEPVPSVRRSGQEADGRREPGGHLEGLDGRQQLFQAVVRLLEQGVDGEQHGDDAGLFLLFRRPVEGLEQLVAVGEFRGVEGRRAARREGEDAVQRFRHGVTGLHALVALPALQALGDDDVDFIVVDGLREEDVGADAVAVDTALHIGKGGHQDDRRLLRAGILLQFTADFVARQAAEHDVQQDDVGLFLPGQVEAGKPVFR